jgi:hypothetical protein
MIGATSVRDLLVFACIPDAHVHWRMIGGELLMAVIKHAAIAPEFE